MENIPVHIGILSSQKFFFFLYGILRAAGCSENQRWAVYSEHTHTNTHTLTHTHTHTHTQKHTHPKKKHKRTPTHWDKHTHTHKHIHTLTWTHTHNSTSRLAWLWDWMSCSLDNDKKNSDVTPLNDPQGKCKLGKKKEERGKKKAVFQPLTKVKR